MVAPDWQLTNQPVDSPAKVYVSSHTGFRIVLQLKLPVQIGAAAAFIGGASGGGGRKGLHLAKLHLTQVLNVPLYWLQQLREKSFIM